MRSACVRRRARLACARRRRSGAATRVSATAPTLPLPGAAQRAERLRRAGRDRSRRRGCARARAHVATFKPLPHRLQPLGERDGIEYVNDSIATTPYATSKRCAASRTAPVTVLVGGFDRGVDWQRFARHVATHPPHGDRRRWARTATRSPRRCADRERRVRADRGADARRGGRARARDHAARRRRSCCRPARRASTSSATTPSAAANSRAWRDSIRPRSRRSKVWALHERAECANASADPRLGSADAPVPLDARRADRAAVRNGRIPVCSTWTGISGSATRRSR